MSSLMTHSDRGAPPLAAQRLRAAGRSRRADAGALTEMTRALLRDARDDATGGGSPRRGAVASAERAARRELAGTCPRLSPRPFAARRA
jgi:hypothetical protein